MLLGREVNAVGVYFVNPYTVNPATVPLSGSSIIIGGSRIPPCHPPRCVSFHPHNESSSPSVFQSIIIVVRALLFPLLHRRLPQYHVELGFELLDPGFLDDQSAIVQVFDDEGVAALLIDLEEDRLDGWVALD